MSPNIIIVFAVLAVLAFFFFQRRSDTTGADARRLVEAGAKLIDVRTPSEFADAHLPGAVNIPIDDLTSRVRDLGPKDKPVVVYCQSGMRSASAARTLRSAGFTSVHNLGPMSSW